MFEIAQLIDPVAATIVIGGSILATSARCGFGHTKDAAMQVLKLPTPSFKYARVRAALAPMVSDIKRSGLIRAQIVKSPDAAVNEGLEAMLRRRSFTAFLAHQQSHRELRLARRFRASESLDTAGELAPILGLTGTLIALSQLDPSQLADASAMTSAISTAILSTLYGLLLAHFVCHPLARAVERRSVREEDARAAVTDWLADHIPESDQLEEPAEEPASNWALDAGTTPTDRHLA